MTIFPINSDGSLGIITTLAVTAAWGRPRLGVGFVSARISGSLFTDNAGQDDAEFHGIAAEYYLQQAALPELKVPEGQASCAIGEPWPRPAIQRGPCDLHSGGYGVRALWHSWASIHLLDAQRKPIIAVFESLIANAYSPPHWPLRPPPKRKSERGPSIFIDNLVVLLIVMCAR